MTHEGGVFKNMAKDSKFEQRLAELNAFYAPLPPEKMVLARPLIDNAVFIESQLEELQHEIRANGTTDEYKNGNNQYGTKQSASVQSYNALVKSYNMISQRLAELMPKQDKAKSKLETLIDE